MKILRNIFRKKTKTDVESTKPDDYEISEKTRAVCELMMARHKNSGAIRACGSNRPTLEWLYRRMIPADAGAPEQAFAIVRHPDRLEYIQLSTDEATDITSPFIDRDTETPNDATAAVFGASFRGSAAFMAHLQGSAMPEGAEIFLGLKTTMLKLDKYGYTGASTFVAYETIESEDIVANIVKEHSRRRVDALSKALDGAEPDKDDLEALGEPDYDAIISALDDGASPAAEDLEMAERAFGRLNSERPKHGERKALIKKTALAIAKALHAKGLHFKALYYAGVAAIDEGPEAEASRLRAEISKAAPGCDLAPTRMGTALQWCFSLAPSDLHSMILVRDGKKIGECHGGKEIMGFDLNAAAREEAPLMAFISYGRGSIISIEAKRLDNDRINAMFYKPSPMGLTDNDDSGIAFTYPTDTLLSRDEFLRRRTSISQRLVDNEEISDDDMLMLGHCEDAHFEYAIGLKAREANLMGEAIFRFWRAIAIAKKEANDTDANDARLLRYAPLGMAGIWTGKKRHVAAMAALEAADGGEPTANAIMMSAMAGARDPRATRVIKKALDRQTSALININDGKPDDAFNPTLYKFLRCSYYNALVNDGRYLEAKARLAAMHADPSPDIRDFALTEAYNLARMGLL